MKRVRITEEQIIGILQEQEEGQKNTASFVGIPSLAATILSIRS